MRVCTRPWVSRIRVFRSVVVGAVVMFLAALPAGADVLTVDCSGADPAAFPTITAALNSLPVNSPTEPHLINVTGTCTENVSVMDRERVTIRGTPAGNATIMAANPLGVVVTIQRSRSITLQNFVIRGGTIGVNVSLHSFVTIQGCTIENNTGTGLAILNLSTVLLAGALASQGVQVINNGGQGINVSVSFLQIGGNTTIDSNGSFGLNVSSGRLSMVGTAAANLIRNNGFGVNIVAGSAATFVGQNTIENNGSLGVQVAQSSQASFTSTTLGGMPRVTVIEGHETVGMNIVRLGEVSFNGPHRIQNNGFAPADPTLQAGIRVSRSSLSMEAGAEVSGNFGPGILVDHNSSFFAMDTLTSSNNSGEGIRVIHQSVAGLTGVNMLTGNSSFALACDGTSLVYGNLAGVSNINCSRIEREVGPPRRGAIMEN